MTILKRMGAVSVPPASIRRRMSLSAPRAVGVRTRRLARRGAVFGLSAAGLLHVVWATGSSWPAGSRDELADLVVGVRPFPSNPMTTGVVALIGIGAGLVVSESRRLDAESVATPGSSGRLTTSEGVLRAAAWGVPAVLALRGVGGLVVSAAGLGQATAIFRRWDLRLYSPLCVVIGALAFLAVRPNSAEGDAKDQ